ncbi:hypothetical protein LTR66_007550 [Elasticomyces elasticus]|nr:hypothetical protein LTR66_007550 [Elasticomyces elasticus]
MANSGDLNDAAIALRQVLGPTDFVFGIFGGYACGALGGPRISKDVDCLVNATKEQIVRELNGKCGFTWTGNTRKDYVAFLWSVKGTEAPVLVECFPTPTQIRHPLLVAVTGSTLGTKSIQLLDPVSIFKGKLRAAATRDKFSDSVDLAFLEEHYRKQLQARRSEISPMYVAQALERWPILQDTFIRLGMDLDSCKKTAVLEAQSSDYDAQGSNAVQNGIAFGIPGQRRP